MTTNTTPRVVYTGDSSWWDIVSRGEIEVGESDWGPRETEAAEVADLNLDDPECWSAVVTYVDPRHSAIRVGDFACCGGCGDDVQFVRLPS